MTKNFISNAHDTVKKKRKYSIRCHRCGEITMSCVRVTCLCVWSVWILKSRRGEEANSCTKWENVWFVKNIVPTTRRTQIIYNNIVVYHTVGSISLHNTHPTCAAPYIHYTLYAVACCKYFVSARASFGDLIFCYLSSTLLHHPIVLHFHIRFNLYIFENSVCIFCLYFFCSLCIFPNAKKKTNPKIVAFQLQSST